MSAFREWANAFVSEKRDHDLEFRDAVKAAWNACAREAVKRIRERTAVYFHNAEDAERAARIVESLLEE